MNEVKKAMLLKVPFGLEAQEFEVSERDLLFSGSMQEVLPLKDIEKSILDQLDHPIGCPPLKEIASGKSNIVILIEDSTRNTPLKKILPVLLSYLEGIGIRDRDISFLTAPGTHRIMTEKEIVEKVGIEIFGRYRIDQHDATKPDTLVNLGYVDAGDYSIPVHVNRKALEADLLIGLGDIVPHSDAGYSGGAKIVQPGVCGFATTAATHVSAALLSDIPLGLMENPCRAGIEKVARKVRLSYILNTVKNMDGDIVGLFGGDFVEAHRRGASLAREVYRVDIPERADIVVVSSSPCDIDYWQAEKGLIAAYFAVKPGGIIIFAAPCVEGLSHNHPRFREWLVLPFSEALEKARKEDPENVEADLVAAVLAICNARIREKSRIFSVTQGLTEEDIRVLGYEAHSSVSSALDKALEMIPGGSIGVLPKGGVSLPVLRSQ